MAGANRGKAALRQDPDPRPTDGWSTSFCTPQNQDPSLHYVWVNQAGNAHMGTDYYESIGYDVVNYEETGVRLGRFSSKNKMGQPVTFRGMVLMACPKTQKAWIEQHGEDGTGGQEELDRITAQIQNKKFVPSDVSKGLSQYGLAVNRDPENHLNPTESASG